MEGKTAKERQRSEGHDQVVNERGKERVESIKNIVHPSTRNHVFEISLNAICHPAGVNVSATDALDDGFGSEAFSVIEGVLETGRVVGAVSGAVGGG